MLLERYKKAFIFLMNYFAKFYDLFSRQHKKAEDNSTYKGKYTTYNK